MYLHFSVHASFPAIIYEVDFKYFIMFLHLSLFELIIDCENRLNFYVLSQPTSLTLLMYWRGDLCIKRLKQSAFTTEA